MGAISKRAVVVATKDHLSCDLAEEAVVLHLTSGAYFGLNEVAAAVWNLLQAPHTVEEIETHVLSQYKVEREQCERDLSRLLGDLAQAGLLQITDATGDVP